jgi:ABC-type glycerol-3-phosphate transport system substrate-binding protein
MFNFGKKSLSLILTVVFVFALITACGKPAATPAAETAAETTAAETTSILDTLPKVNLEDITVRALARNDSWWQLTEISSEELNGEVINDAIYNRNLKLESHLRITFEVEHVDSVGTTIRSLIMADDDQYDFVMPNMNESATLAADDMFVNLKKISSLDMTNPAWDQNANDYFSIAGKLYYGVSDISLGKNEAIWCYMFNKTLIDDYALENPYQLVRDGKWTFDKSHEMMTVATKDLNGDGKMTSDVDQYGLATHDVNYYALMIAGGEPLAGKDNNGMPVITVGDQRFTAVYDKICALFPKNDMTVIEYQGQTFIAGRSLLCGQVLACVRLYRSMEDDFGIIPMPKYDDVQEKYYTYVIPYDIFAASVPITVKDTDVSGVVLQTLAILSDYYVTPAYYDITITGKGLRDEESAEMLDIILKSTVYDLARMYDWGTLASGIQTNIIAQKEFASFYAKREKHAKKALEKTIDAFSANVN